MDPLASVLRRTTCVVLAGVLASACADSVDPGPADAQPMVADASLDLSRTADAALMESDAGLLDSGFIIAHDSQVDSVSCSTLAPGPSAENQDSGMLDFGIDQRPRQGTCRTLVRPTGMQDDSFPQKLSGTGCFRADDLREPAAGLIPYDVNSPLWSDGAAKRRWMMVPYGLAITINADGDWDLPPGSMLMKTFQLGSVMLETRFLVRHADGEWAGYTYVWDAAGANEATLLPRGPAVRQVGGQRWVFPSRENCMACHTQAAGRSLGLQTSQLNRTMMYAEAKEANQLATLQHIGMFAAPLPPSASWPRMPDPARVDSGTLQQRARAYLHSNCSHCHRPGAEMMTTMDLRYETLLHSANALGAMPLRGNYGVPDALLLAPGAPDQSIVVFRMSVTVPNVRMPGLGSDVLDVAGLNLVRTWISSLQACELQK